MYYLDKTLYFVTAEGVLEHPKLPSPINTPLYAPRVNKPSVTWLDHTTYCYSCIQKIFELFHLQKLQVSMNIAPLNTPLYAPRVNKPSVTWLDHTTYCYSCIQKIFELFHLQKLQVSMNIAPIKIKPLTAYITTYHCKRELQQWD